MEISQIATLPVPSPNRLNAGWGVPAPAASTISSTIPSSLNMEPSKTGRSTTVENRDTLPSDRLAQAVKQVNDAFSQRGKDLYAAFEKDRLTGVNVVKIVDYKTNEIIGQLPLKEMVRFAQLMEYQQGIKGQLVHDIA